jgi:hypothetical protein
MHSIDASYVVCSIADTVLNRREPAKHNEDYTITQNGIFFKLDLTLSYYPPDDAPNDYRTADSLYIILCGNVHVWVAGCDLYSDEGRWIRPEQVPLDKWNNTSNHDSCWRSDGVQRAISKIYSKQSNRINELLVADGLEPVAPIKMSQHNSLGLGKAWTDVEITHDSDADSSYHRKVVSVK